MRLKEKVAIVTGGASGIGKAICIAFAREGAQVVIVDIDKAKSEAAMKDITAAGKAIALQADVTSSASVNAMANEAHRRFGRIDILVNNVGVRIVKPFLAHTDEDWNTMLATSALRFRFLRSGGAAQQLVGGGEPRLRLFSRARLRREIHG